MNKLKPVKYPKIKKEAFKKWFKKREKNEATNKV